jgi:hypothetical protein
MDCVTAMVEARECCRLRRDLPPCGQRPESLLRTEGSKQNASQRLAQVTLEERKETGYDASW